MKFNWWLLIIGIVALTAFAAGSPRYGKWLFAIVVFGALVLGTNKMMSNLTTPGG